MFVAKWCYWLSIDMPLILSSSLTRNFSNHNKVKSCEMENELRS
jgi:hypothetical protein